MNFSKYKEHILTESPHGSFSNKENMYLDGYLRFLKTKNFAILMECVEERKQK